MDDGRPSRESMREVKRQYKERQKAEKKRAKAAADYWAAESGRPAPRRRNPFVAALAAVAFVGLIGAAGYVVLGLPAADVAGGAAPPSSAPPSSGFAEPTTSPTPDDSGEGALDGVPTRMMIMTALAPPGSCLSRLDINPDGGRRIRTGSCDTVHVAEVVSLTDGSELWTEYPDAAQRRDFDDQCVAQGLLFLGWKGGTDAEATAFIERALERGIAIQSAFPSPESWERDAAIICAIGQADGLTPAGSLRGSMLG